MGISGSADTWSPSSSDGHYPLAKNGDLAILPTRQCWKYRQGRTRLSQEDSSAFVVVGSRGSELPMCSGECYKDNKIREVVHANLSLILSAILPPDTPYKKGGLSWSP